MTRSWNGSRETSSIDSLDNIWTLHWEGRRTCIATPGRRTCIATPIHGPLSTITNLGPDTVSSDCPIPAAAHFRGLRCVSFRPAKAERCSNGRAPKAASSWRDSSASEAARSGDRRSTTSGSSAPTNGRRRASSLRQRLRAMVNSQVENADRFGSNDARDRNAARNTSWATPSWSVSGGVRLRISVSSGRW